LINTIRISLSLGDLGRVIFVTLLVAILIAYVLHGAGDRSMDKCKIVFVYCPGNGRHMARRQLHLIHRGGNVLIRCELCGIYWLQRSEDRSARVVDQGATGTERNLRLATNVRHWGMRTADQILSPAAREALACRQAARASTLIDQLAEQAQGRDDIRTECAG
jgi:hypothetical protein